MAKNRTQFFIVRDDRDHNAVREITVHEDDAQYIETEADRCTRTEVLQLEHMLKVYRAVIETLKGIEDPAAIERALKEWKRTNAPGI